MPISPYTLVLVESLTRQGQLPYPLPLIANDVTRFYQRYGIDVPINVSPPVYISRETERELNSYSSAELAKGWDVLRSLFYAAQRQYHSVFILNIDDLPGAFAVETTFESAAVVGVIRNGWYISGDEVEWATAHEIGHTLTLPHTSDTGNLMAPRTVSWQSLDQSYLTLEQVSKITGQPVAERVAEILSAAQPVRPTIISTPLPSGPAPTPLPSGPALSKRMLGSVELNLLPSVDRGNTLVGDVIVHTILPPDLKDSYPRPTYPLAIYVEAQDPGVQTWQLANVSTQVILGQDIFVPIKFDSANVSIGTSNIRVLISDVDGYQLLWELIGTVRVLPSGVSLAAPVSTPQLGNPTIEATSSVVRGAMWSGTLSIPSSPGKVNVYLEVIDPLNQGFTVINAPFELPASLALGLDTSKVSTGTSNIWLQLTTSDGRQLFWKQLGSFQVLPAAPVAPAMVTPSPEMLGTPVPSLPTEVTQGQTWSGNISIPTFVKES